MKWASYGLMLLIGGFIGQALIQLSNSHGNREVRESGGEAGNSASARIRPTAAGTGIDGFLRSEMGISEKKFSFEATTKLLHDQSFSPQRTGALLAYGIQARDGKQLMEDFKNGEIGSLELDAVIRRLATENPDEIWRLSSTAKISVQSWEDFMTVHNAIIQTLTKNEGPAVIDRLSAMEPSRHRLFIADIYSSFWAKHDPAAAAVGFDQVLQLNPSGNAFAEQIVKSWNSKDPSAMTAYVSQLPAGSTRQFFEKAIDKVVKK